MPARTVTSKLFPVGTAVQAFKLNEADVERRESRAPIPDAEDTGVIDADHSVDLTLDAGHYVLAGVVDEVQVVTLTAATGGTFTLTYAGQETSGIAYDAAASAVETALEALSNIAAGDVAVSGDAGGPWTVTFRQALGGEDVSELVVDESSLVGTDEVQEVTIAATAGQFKITFDGQETGNIAYDANAATVETALEALSNVEADDITVSGGPGDENGTSPYVLTFDGGDKASADVPEVTVADGDTPLSGGDGASVETTTPGVTPTADVDTDPKGSKSGASGQKTVMFYVDEE